MAQNSADPTDIITSIAPSTPLPTTMMTSTGTFDSPSIPSHSDNASGSTNGDSSSVPNFSTFSVLFIALAVCLAGAGVFICWRRKKRVRRQLFLSSQRNPYGNVVARAGQRHGLAGARSAEMSREDGLNEHGEAPPPYFPKQDNAGPGGSGQDDVPIPLRTLAREDAALKPPDYADASIRAQGLRSGSVASSSSNDQRQRVREL